MDEDARLPKDLEAEDFILGALLLDYNEAWKIAKVLRKNDLYSANNWRIWEAIEACAKKDGVEPVKVAEVLDGNDGYISTEYGVEDPLDNLNNLVAEVPEILGPKLQEMVYRIKKASFRRSIISECTRCIQAAYKNDEQAFQESLAMLQLASQGL